MTGDFDWRKGLEELDRALIEFELDPAKTALVIVDMQYKCAHPDYGMGPLLKQQYPKAFSFRYDTLAQVAIPTIRKLLDFFREKGVKVIHITLGSELPDASDISPSRRSKGRQHLYPPGSLDNQIIEELKPKDNELVINKRTVGAFASTGIDLVLRNMGITSIVFTGVCTSGCMELTAREAVDRGYYCVIVEDGCANEDREAHYTALRNFARKYGKVQFADEVMAELDEKLAGQVVK